nr:tubulin specific chaperone A [Hymenolepis microstoma]
MATVVPDSRLRQLKIRSNVVKRIAKDKEKYEEEYTMLQQKHDAKKASGAEDIVIKKSSELLEETKMMISDCSSRLTKAYGDLETCFSDCSDLCDHEEYKCAKTILDEKCSCKH